MAVELVNFSGFKLGRLPFVPGTPTVRLKPFVNRARLLQAPASWKWSTYVPSWPMLDNDRLGDCTCAGILHARQLWRAAAGVTYLPTNAEVDALYQNFGYDPADPSTDQGAVETDVLKFCQKTGFADGDKLGPVVALDVGDSDQLRYTIWQLAVAYMGVALPISAQTQSVWDVVKLSPKLIAPGSWGLHCIIAVDYGPEGVWVVTWGKLMLMTWSFWAAYIDETYAIASDDFINAQGQTPLGLDLAGLDAATESIAA
jgi:hypothetical protein